MVVPEGSILMVTGDSPVIGSPVIGDNQLAYTSPARGKGIQQADNTLNPLEMGEAT